MARRPSPLLPGEPRKGELHADATARPPNISLREAFPAEGGQRQYAYEKASQPLQPQTPACVCPHCSAEDQRKLRLFRGPWYGARSPGGFLRFLPQRWRVSICSRGSCPRAKFPGADVPSLYTSCRIEKPRSGQRKLRGGLFLYISQTWFQFRMTFGAEPKWG